jgi:hypothetical protein
MSVSDDFNENGKLQNREKSGFYLRGDDDEKETAILLQRPLDKHRVRVC